MWYIPRVSRASTKRIGLVDGGSFKLCVGPLLDFDFAEASAMEQQLLLDLKEQFLEWSNMLQSISELGGAAMAGIL